MTIQERLQELRSLMKNQKVSALIVPGTDPHGSEYIAEHWQERQFISGFTGSAGTVVITADKAGLWTDSRYFLQAEAQLADTGIALFKEGIMTTPSIVEWLGSVLVQGDQVAVNPAMFSITSLKCLKDDLLVYGLTLNTNYDLISAVWKNRPALPNDYIFELTTQYSGRTTLDKLTAVRAQMSKNKVDVLLLSALDDIAWLFNIRGNDVECNPVTISYAVVEMDSAILFIDSTKLTADVKDHLVRSQVSTQSYEEISAYIKSLPSGKRIGVDSNKVNYALYEAVPAACQVVEMVSPVFHMKCIKNEVELSGLRHALVKDGVALVKFFRWLEKSVPTGDVSELSAIEQLRHCREEQSLFVTESFGTIAGYAEHGAIVHYDSTEDSNVTLKSENFFLLDSGGQYLDGTTDITRTVALGPLSAQQKRDFTLVLKGHIALAMAKFPYGTRGNQLDILARQFLWQNGLQYGHGTGHGVGHFLCVHEGPQSIRMDENPTILQPGMVLSNEPGLYRTNEYGIRCENLVTVREVETNDFGKFLNFETLTLFPFDSNAIDTSMLTLEEKEWLNNYHQMVYDRLSPVLDDVEKEWLKLKTQAI
ncbi:MAG: aminopeptidase P family protein [Prevotellaceae bacterium]|nr:aminopeptidase P family protein [Prevotellaceae bacterium]